MSSPVPLPHQGPARIGQGTAIEQSRAAAEVYASVLAAKSSPRDVQAAIAAMEDACRMPELAERAFYRFGRGGQQVTGASIHLARELARCWGNIQYGVQELRRDDLAHQSEMQAFAWDIETNARSSSIFIVPHVRDTKRGTVELTDARDVYESNANAGSRRVREAIFAVLPAWYTERAKALCEQTLRDGGGRPLPERIAAALAAFAELGVDEERLVAKVGRPTARWTPMDLAPLAVILQSIRRGETTVEAEFPVEQVLVTPAELAAPKRRGSRSKTEQLQPDEQELLDELDAERGAAEAGAQ